MISEYDQRLSGILEGPWRKESQLARSILPQLSDYESRRYFRSHHGDTIRDKREIAFRESFDQALDGLQILELAVCSGYLPLDVVRPSAEEEFRTLLDSAPSRGYLAIYDFLPVRFLADRLGIDIGLEPIKPPSVNPGGGLRFATFLAVHSDFTTSDAVEKFCRLLDDYRFDGLVNRDYFVAHLADPSIEPLRPEERAIPALCLGFFEFVHGLGDMFLQLDGEEVPLYGCFYAYWLAKFFGERKSHRGYERINTPFTDTDIERVLVYTWGDAAPDAELQRTRHAVATLNQSWRATKTLLESATGDAVDS